MSHSERMSSVDTTWLRMDHPANLMMIVGVWVLEGPVALDKVEDQIVEGLMRYPRYRQKVEYTATGVYWRDDPNFDLSHHIKHVRLPGRGDKQALERFVGELASEPLDPKHPLWTEHIVEDYEGGAALVFRGHHAMADGMALMGVTMSLIDGPVQKGPRRRPPEAEEGWLKSLTPSLVSVIDIGTRASASARAALGLARHPLSAMGYMRDAALVAGELAYLLFMKTDSPTRFKGKPSGSKRVAWCEPLKLAEVKAVSLALECSINDVLLSCVAGAMRRYLADKGDSTEGLEIRALVPIDRREEGDAELGNRFGLLMVELPVGVEHPIARLRTVRQRMLALKNSYEPATTLGLLAALGYVPKAAQEPLLDLLASRSTAVMTNVPGPTERPTVAGSPLKQWLSWVPQTGDIGMGVSIFSYADQVQFGLITDAALTPDPEALVSRFPEEFEEYLYTVLLNTPAAAEPRKTAEAPRPSEPERAVAAPSSASVSAGARAVRPALGGGVSHHRKHGERRSTPSDARKPSMKRLRRRA